MANITLLAEIRDIKGRKTDSLRREGKVPGVVYGFEIESTNITIDRNEMERFYRLAGESTVLNLEINGENHEVLIQDIQRDAITEFIIHCDFRKLDMSKKIEALIKLELVGEACQ